MELRVLEEVTATQGIAGGSPSLQESRSLGEGESWSEMIEQRLELTSESRQGPPEARLSALEAAVNKEASRADGPVLDAQVVRAFRLADFYSSVYAKAQYDFDRYASTDEAEKLGNSLANPPAGTAAELKDWILHRVHLRRSAEGVRAVAVDLSRMRHIGVAPLSRISYSVAISGSTDIDLVKRMPVRGYFERLDSRPSNLHAAFRTASELLNDPVIMERCMRPAVERGPRQISSDLPWALRFLGDKDGLRALAADKTWQTYIRSSALQELAGMEESKPQVLVDRFRELIREDPTVAGPLLAAVGVLENQDQVESALQLIDEWLKAHASRDLTWAGVTSVKSRLLRKRGKFQEAWRTAQPAAATWKGDCLEEGTLALIDLGRLDEALDMAKAALERYGGEAGAALVARVLWTKGRDDEAAQLLNSPQRRFSGTAWAWEFPAAFSEAFKNADEKRAEVAFLKLAEPSVPTLDIVWFVEYLTGHGQADLSVRICERLPRRSPTGWMTVTMYHALRKAKGAGAARDWIRANCTPAELDIFAKQALQDRDFELPWDLPDSPDPTKNEILYLIRAASLLYKPDKPEVSEERRARLIAFFQSRPRKDFVVYGLSLLGQIDRATLFAQIKDPEYVCSVGWILGLVCAHEGRYEEANGWLQVSMQAGSNVPPLYWASAILGNWSRERCVLSEIARKGIY